jgi:hypothetical protein
VGLDCVGAYVCSGHFALLLLGSCAIRVFVVDRLPLQACSPSTSYVSSPRMYQDCSSGVFFNCQAVHVRDEFCNEQSHQPHDLASVDCIITSQTRE